MLYVRRRARLPKSCLLRINIPLNHSVHIVPGMSQTLLEADLFLLALLVHSPA